MNARNLSLAERLELEMKRKVQAYVTRREFDYTHEEALEFLLSNSIQGATFRAELVKRCEAAW